MSMKFLLPATLLSVTLVLAGCGTAAHDDLATAEPAQTDPTDKHTEEVNGTEETPSVTLDNGLRWKANPETTTGIANMSAILQAFDPASRNANTLKAALEEEFSLIFERCTMEGEAHNQLHNYLIPIHHALREFDGNAAHDREAMATHLATYTTYFQ